MPPSIFDEANKVVKTQLPTIDNWNAHGPGYCYVFLYLHSIYLYKEVDRDVSVARMVVHILMHHGYKAIYVIEDDYHYTARTRIQVERKYVDAAI